MKKILCLLVCIMVFPLGVHAMAYSESFVVGEGVSVSFDGSKTKIGFHVLKNSASGDNTVTLIYDGSLGTSVYSETNPGVTTSSTDYSTSKVKTFLDGKITSSGWIVQNQRLLEKDDLTNLGLTKNTDGSYTIPTKYDFLKAVKTAGYETNMYEYWTQIADDSEEKIYVVRESLDTAISGTLTLEEVGGISTNVAHAVRPVVVVDKQYIECKTNTTNVNTGLEDYIIPLASASVILVGAIYLTKRNTLFKEI